MALSNMNNCEIKIPSTFRCEAYVFIDLSFRSVLSLSEVWSIFRTKTMINSLYEVYEMQID